MEEQNSTQQEQPEVLKHRHVSLIGIILIILGAALILSRLHILHYGWGIVFWGSVGLYGLLVVVMAFTTRRRGTVFIGSLAFFMSVGVIVHRLSYLDYAPWDWFAVLSLAMGLAFLMLFIYDPRYVGVLIPTILFGAYGILYYLWWYDVIEWFDVQHYVRTYWPLLLVVWGLSILFRPRR